VHAWVFRVLLLCGPVVALAQDADDLAAVVKRIASAHDPAHTRVELGLACLENFDGESDLALQRELRLGLGIALSELERFREAHEHFSAAEELSRRTKDEAVLAHSLWQRAVMSFRLGEFEDAIAASLESTDVAESIGRRDILWRAANLLGLTLERTGEYDAALDAFTQGLEAAERLGDDTGISVLLGSIGIARMNLGEYEEALELYQRALEREQAQGETRGLSSTLANLGDVHFLLGELEESYDYHQEALRIREKLGIESEVSRSLHSLGAICLAREDPEGALRHFEKALEIRRRLDMAPEQVETLLAMAHVHVELDHGEAAAVSAQQSSAIAERLDMKGRRLAVLEALAKAQEQRGDFEEALETSREAVGVEREQRSLETRQSFARFQAELETREKEQEIAVLRRDQEIQNLELKQQALLRRGLLIGAALLAVVAIAGWLAWGTLRRTHCKLAAVNDQLVEVNRDLGEAVQRIRTLEGILPICSYCKNIRDESGEWHLLESYITEHSSANFTHSICPKCVEKEFPDLDRAPGSA